MWCDGDRNRGDRGPNPLTWVCSSRWIAPLLFRPCDCALVIVSLLRPHSYAAYSRFFVAPCQFDGPDRL